MILITTRMDVPEVHVATFVDAVRVVVAATTENEPGCRVYECGRDVLNPLQFFFVEEWEDMAAIGSHAKAKHFEKFVETTSGFLTNQVTTIHVVEKSRTL